MPAMNSLTELILTLQGDGDYAGVKKLFNEQGNVGEELKNAHEPITTGLKSLGDNVNNLSEPLNEAMINISRELEGVSQPIIQSIDKINEQ